MLPPLCGLHRVLQAAVVLHRRRLLKKKTYNILKLRMQYPLYPSGPSGPQRRSLAGWTWLYMGQMVNLAGVRFAFESSNGDIGLPLTHTLTQRLRSDEQTEHMTSAPWQHISILSTTVLLLLFAKGRDMTYWATTLLQHVIW